MGIRLGDKSINIDISFDDLRDRINYLNSIYPHILDKKMSKMPYISLYDIGEELIIIAILLNKTYPDAIAKRDFTPREIIRAVEQYLPGNQ